MKKQIKSILVSAFVACMFAACGSGKNESNETKADSTSTQMAASYECPMHAEVKSDKPGACEKCGMDLEKK